jgi:hypothetical protein
MTGENSDQETQHPSQKPTQPNHVSSPPGALSREENDKKFRDLKKQPSYYNT